MKRTIKHILPNSLFGRSLLILIVPVLLIQIISSIIFFNRHWEEITGRLAFAVAGEIAFIVAELEGGEGMEAARFRNLSNFSARHLDLILNYEQGGRLGAGKDKNSRSIVGRTLDNELSGQLNRPYTVEVDIQKKKVRVAVQMEDGTLHVILPQRRLFSSSGYIFLLWMIGVSIALLAVAVLFLRNQIRPIRRLAVAAERFGKGRDIPPTFKPEGAREVRQAAQAFIEMYDRIKRQIQQRTAMLAGVSHDLRTPLTRMKLQAAMLPNSPDVEALKADIGDMEKMIDAYLDFARGEGSEPTSRTDLKEILQRIAGKARRQNVAIDLNMPAGGIFLQLRPIAFERSLANIVSNACKYANKIWVEVALEADTVEIVINDDGPGIPPDQYEEVFKPFVRGEPSRNQATGGVGLGLPIARDIIAGHGGRIWLEKSPHGGLQVNIAIPR